jgi:hypothetical protein
MKNSPVIYLLAIIGSKTVLSFEIAKDTPPFCQKVRYDT